MALALGNFSATTPLSRSVIGGSLVQQRAGGNHRSQLCAVTSEKGSSTATRGGDVDLSRRDFEKSVAESLKGAVGKAKSMLWMPLVGAASVGEHWLSLSDAAQGTGWAEDSEEEQAGRTVPSVPPVPNAFVPQQEVVQPAVEESRSRKKGAAAVTFTPEKARALRKTLRESKTWHDGWYHSGIASRLAEESY